MSDRPSDVAAVVGRDREMEAVERLLRDPAAPASALVIEGEPGVGKTSLWRLGRRLAEARSTVLAAELRPGTGSGTASSGDRGSTSAGSTGRTS